MLVVPRLLFEPPREPAFDVFVIESLAALDLIGTAADLVENVHLVLNVLEARVVREMIQQSANLVFGGVHDGILVDLAYLPFNIPKIPRTICCVTVRVAWRATVFTVRSIAD